MDLELQESDKFKYIESNGGDHTIILLHGLLGQLSNFEGIFQHFSDKYNIVFPHLPILEMPVKEVGLGALLQHVTDFIEHKAYKKVSVLGNSLGGHLAQLYTINNPEKVETMILTGSSGLFESAMGSTFPKRGNYEYIKEKAQSTFFDPSVATKELVDEIFETVNDRMKAIRIVATAKSAVRHNLSDKLHMIKVPTLLVWGQQDGVTPPFVAEKFNELLENSELHFIDKCGHAPMMEHPNQFNEVLEKFLQVKLT